MYFSLKDSKYGEIKWVRIGEVHRGKHCALYSKDMEDRCTVVDGHVPLSYMAVGMTAVGNTAGCLERLFECHNANDYGIYLVRLFIEGVWRYVVVDDYVPTVSKDKKLVPLFLSTQ